ncbi:MAG: B12-binding domain-containing radical SAM protein, partial [Planctomycetaceae bacterium]
MSTILLSTLNARYSHTSFGLRCLRAAMGPLHDQTEIAEFTINDSLHSVLADIVERNPRILGLGVYIWNVELIVSLLRDLVRLLPHTTVVLGGPELAGTPENREHAELIELADYVITGEGDHAFAALCTQILAGTPPQSRFINAGAANLRELPLPYGEYTDTDLAERIVYVELSRGCPFTCEFCLSALDIPVRIYPLQEFLVAMDELLKRGLRQFKFVDRTFNLNIRLSESVLQFFLQRLSPDLFLHFLGLAYFVAGR